MVKDFIQYTEALELKQLGFNEPCFGVFSFEKFNFGVFSSLSSTENTILVPTYSQAFRWFREKHNLKSWIQEHTSDTFIYEIRPHVLSDYKQGETYVYTNYEKVELACLKKLIEIIKNK